MSAPSASAMRFAAEWLEMYEADTDEEAADIKAVADWLIARADAKDTSATIKKVAKDRGLPVSFVRKAVKKMEGQ